jgi:hypothetical protein
MFHGCNRVDITAAKAWYTENLQISVPVTVVAGLFVLMIILYCFKGMVIECPLTKSDGVCSGVPACQQKSVETVINRTCIGSHTWRTNFKLAYRK